MRGALNWTTRTTGSTCLLCSSSAPFEIGGTLSPTRCKYIGRRSHRDQTIGYASLGRSTITDRRNTVHIPASKCAKRCSAISRSISDIVDWAARATGDRGQRFSCVGLHLARNYFILQNHSSIFAVFAERDFSQGPVKLSRRRGTRGCCIQPIDPPH